MLDLRPRGRRFEPHRHHCVVSLSKNINPSLVLVQPRKTCPFITERLLMGCKESNQTSKTFSNSEDPDEMRHFISSTVFVILLTKGKKDLQAKKVNIGFKIIT